MKRHIEFLTVTGLISFLMMLGCGGSSRPPMSVSVSVSPAAVTLGASESQQFSASVTNSSNAGVTWGLSGCSATTCGTISSSGLYTAPSLIPSPATVTVTATSQGAPSASGTAAVTLVPLAVEVSPSQTLHLGAGAVQNFTASVTRHANHDVTWRLSGTGCTGDACGTLTNITSRSATYNAPPTVPNAATVAVSATAVADTTKSTMVSINLMPISVSLSPGTAAYAVLRGTRNYSATLQYDPHNAGVTWALSGTGCSGNGCGTLTDVTHTSAVYHAPSTVPNPPTVTLTATSITDPSKSAEVIITISAAALREGDYAFSFNGWQDQRPGSAVVVAGRFHADAYGNITDGVEDINSSSGVSQSVPFTGSYGVSPDGRGSFTITTATGTSSFQMTVDPTGENGKFIKFDALPTGAPISGTGYFELQDKAAFSLSALAGPYAMGMFGKVETNDIAAVGRFTAGTDGAFSSGRMDLTVLSSLPESYANRALTGSFGAPSSSTGRGTATVTLAPPPGGWADTFHFAYYVVSDRKLLLVQTDARSVTIPVLSGLIRRQSGSFSVASFNAPTIFNLPGETWFGSTAAVGRMVPDGLGSMTGVIDQNGEAFIIESLMVNQNFLGSYSVDPDGRSTMTLQFGSGSSTTEIAYFFGQNEGFLMETSASNFGRSQVAFGSLKPQAAGPFTAASLSGSFLTNTAVERIAWRTDNYSGLTTFDGTSAVTSSMDISCSGCSRFDFGGTYDVATNGRGTLTFTSPPPERVMVFWIISPREMVGITTANPGILGPVLLVYRR